MVLQIDFLFLEIGVYDFQIFKNVIEQRLTKAYLERKLTF